MDRFKLKRLSVCSAIALALWAATYFLRESAWSSESLSGLMFAVMTVCLMPALALTFYVVWLVYLLRKDTIERRFSEKASAERRR